MSFKHKRRSIRLKGYNYASEGAYFVTLCTNDRRCLLGDVRRGEMILNACGEIVDAWWRKIPSHFSNVEMDEFIVMPNHVHGIIKIVQKNGTNNVGAGSPRPEGKGRRNRAPTLGQILAYFKYGTTKYINTVHNAPGARFWQRNYYENILRNDHDLNQKRRYIKDNPLKWGLDGNNPKNIKV